MVHLFVFTQLHLDGLNFCLKLDKYMNLNKKMLNCLDELLNVKNFKKIKFALRLHYKIINYRVQLVIITDYFT